MPGRPLAHPPRAPSTPAMYPYTRLAMPDSGSLRACSTPRWARGSCRGGDVGRTLGRAGGLLGATRGHWGGPLQARIPVRAEDEPAASASALPANSKPFGKCALTLLPRAEPGVGKSSPHARLCQGQHEAEIRPEKALEFLEGEQGRLLTTDWSTRRESRRLPLRRRGRNGHARNQEPR